MKGPSCPFVLEARRETARAFHRSRDVRDQRVVFAQQRGSFRDSFAADRRPGLLVVMATGEKGP